MDLNCEVCDKVFEDSMDGLVEKTFHELIHESKRVEKKTC